MSDNIGGVSSCAYVLVRDVKYCVVLPDRIHVELNPFREWKSFQETAGKTDIQITPADDSSGMYNVAIQLSIPDNRIDEGAVPDWNTQEILVRYRTGNGKMFVVGDVENFLKITVQRLSPSAASGYSGLQININGTLKHPELPLL